MTRDGCFTHFSLIEPLQIGAQGSWIVTIWRQSPIAFYACLSADFSLEVGTIHLFTLDTIPEKGISIQ